MFCEQCGTKRQDESLFCEECGAAFSIETTPTTLNTDNIMSQVNNPTIDVVNNKPKQLSKLHMVFVVLIILLTGSLCSLFHTTTTMNSAEYVAESYVRARALHDYNTMLTFFDNSITNVDYRDIYEQPILDEKIYDLKFSVANEEADFINLAYSFNYGDELQTTSDFVSLVKLNTKKWGILEQWVISPETAVVNDYQIELTAGMEASISGVDIADIAISSKNSTKNSIIYILPDLLCGNYVLTTSYPYGDTVESIMTVSATNLGLTITPKITEETRTSLQEKAVEALEIFLTNAVHHQGYNSLLNDFNALSEYNFTLDKFDYENAIGAVWDKYTYTAKDYEMYNISTKGGTLTYYDEPDFYKYKIGIRGDIKTTGEMAYVGTWGDTDAYSEEIETSIEDFYIEFIYHEDEWVVATIDPVKYY